MPLFKPPELLNVEIKASRGFAFMPEAFAVREGLFEFRLADFFNSVKLKAGEETPVAVQLPSLPLNADIHKITATLEVFTDGSAAAKSNVSLKEGSTERKYEVGVDTVAGLRNLDLRLEGGRPIWNHAGAVPAGSYSIPDFSAQ